ncbi:hypothetical protein C7434_1061 [Pantoea sp. PNA 14-12]|nr:hypothetical protein HA47_17635 [Pantoea stewartii subsp. indologenes]TDS72252.1 hypothetical protein C7434_1061 [Pantoea sp. PNA 14-12]
MARVAKRFCHNFCFNSIFMAFSCSEAGCRIRKQQDAALQCEDAMQDSPPYRTALPRKEKIFKYVI